MADAGELTLALSGALAMGYAVAALFFARFRRRSGAPVFTWFAAAFVLLAVQRVMLLFVERDPGGGAMPWSYLVRLLAFVLILVGIAAQNRARR